jgi:peptide/nickel transport system ATP-binding protein
MTPDDHAIDKTSSGSDAVDPATSQQSSGDNALLEVRHLSTDFDMIRGTVHAVIDVTFSVHEGEVLAIVGESGSGKSVTALSVMRLLQAPGRVVSGDALYQGKNLLALSDSAMRDIRGDRISMIFQEPMTSLNPVFTIENQLVESIRTHMKLDRKAAFDRAVEMLDLVGIPSPKKRIKDYPHQMSGGMRQRVMIAMALSCNPQLLIADEPTTALDVTIQAQILALISDLRDKIGMAVLLITHDLGVVAETADRVVVMYCGRVVEEATAEQLFERPLHPYTLGLLESIPKMDDTDSDEPLYMIPGMVPNPLNMPKGCAFVTRCARRMERCVSEVPDLYQSEGRGLRCFLFDPAGVKPPLIGPSAEEVCS